MFDLFEDLLETATDLFEPIEPLIDADLTTYVVYNGIRYTAEELAERLIL